MTTLRKRIEALEARSKPERVSIRFHFEGDPWLGPDGQPITFEEWRRLNPDVRVIHLSFGDGDGDGE